MYSDRDLARLRPKPSLSVSHFRRCECCFTRHGRITPNPEGRAFCPICDERFPSPVTGRAESVVFKAPAFASMFYWLADKLVAFHDWLRGTK